MSDIIVVEGLTRRFGTFTAVDNVDFTVREGEVLGFLGPNGAGKTTTIKMLMGLLQPSSGSIRIAGLDGQRERRRIKTLIGYMSQKFSLYPLLSACENIEFFGGLVGLGRERIRQAREEIGRQIPAELTRLKIQDLPPGMRQKVALFVCLLPDPRIILLDEPTSGVDPEVRRRFWTDIYGLKKAGKTIMVTTHNLDEAEYADRILIINRGRKIVEGEPQALLRQHGCDSVETLFKEAIQRHETN